MQKQILCFLVLGASLAALQQNLRRRRMLATRQPVFRETSAEVIDLAAWREARSRNEPAASAQ